MKYKNAHGWTKMPLNNVLNLKRGYDLPNNIRNKGKYSVVASNSICGTHNEYKVEGPGVVTGRSGSIGFVQYIENNFWPLNTTLYVNDFKNNNKKFIYYFLKILKLENYKSGTGVPTLNRNHVLNLKVSLPSIEIQEKIGNFLYSIDKKIELNNKINKELEEMAKAIYDYWFVQFDFPDENGKPYKLSGGEMVWSENLKREIPKGWEVKNLKENNLTEIMKAGIEEFENEKIYLPTACVDNVNIKDLSNKIFYKTRESRANMQPQKNSIWFAKMKKSKKIIAVGDYSEFYLKNLIFSTGFCGLQVKEEAFEYIYNFINKEEFESLKDRLATGATQEAINNERLSLIPLIIPRLEVLKDFQKKTLSIHKKIYLNNTENQELESLRDWLLPMLMNGQARIK